MCYVCNVQQFREAIGEKSQTTDRAPGRALYRERKRRNISTRSFISPMSDWTKEGRKEGAAAAAELMSQLSLQHTRQPSEGG